MKPKFTIAQFRAKYHNDDVCLDEILRLQYKDVSHCPKCGNMFNYKRVTTKSKKEGQQRKSYQCVSCGNQIYPLVGTIYEKSRTPLTYWFYAIYLMTATRNGVAAKELERQLGITYKCAFRMAHRIRRLMRITRDSYLDGVIQIDEAFVGGKLFWKHKMQKALLKLDRNLAHGNKLAVVGIIENDKTVSALSIERASEKEILPLIVENIKPGATIVTDGSNIYDSLKDLGYNHIVIRHDLRQWSKGGFHTNSIEGFWAQLKRMVKGTHIKVSKKYFQNYIDEACFRYDLRNRPETMFDTMLRKLA